MERTPERVKVSRSIAGFERTLPSPAHDTARPGWRADVEVVGEVRR
jgi:hypothetical protein